MLTLTIADEYFIGLKRDQHSGKWQWLSKKSSSQTPLPWLQLQPSGDANCTVMYKTDGLRYNDLRCKGASSRAGYIFELLVDDCDQGMAQSVILL